MSALLQGASAPAFVGHPGYRRMFAADALTLGLFLPLRFYQGDMRVLLGQARLVEEIDRLGFAAVWVRDVPLFDPRFGDAGQVFDPFTYLGYLAARTRRIALATGSAVLALRQPVDLAKAAASVDRLSGGRLVLGLASGDRPVEFPAYGLEHAQRGDGSPRAWTTCANCCTAAGTSPRRSVRWTTPNCCRVRRPAPSRWSSPAPRGSRRTGWHARRMAG